MFLRAAKTLNPIWRRHIRKGRMITVPQDGMIQPGQSLMLLGSCFAEEIRLALQLSAPDLKMLPDYGLLDFDPESIRVDELPGRNHMNFYSVFAILQEIERCLGLWDQAEDEYWQIPQGWQDPYRRLVIGKTREDVHRITADLTQIMRDAFASADHFVFTFGMTEVFQDIKSGRYAAQKPGYVNGGGKDETRFVKSGFQANLDRILRLSDLIAEAKPDARIFTTISPVALSMTFSDQDICVANMQSKSTLRAALGEAVSQRENLIYVPSYEAVTSYGPDGFERDGRHVRRSVVEKVTEGFQEAFVAQQG